MDKFRKLGFSEDILKVLEELKFKKPTEIQERTVPLVVEGKDIIACAATGSGKTLAFGSGIIKNVILGKGIQSLVLVPTRELAQQVGDSLRMFSKYKGLNICEIYGGVSYNPQIKAIRNSEVVVGTPGRVLDHLNQNTLSLEKVSILVLDEADRMLDMGFIRDIRRIVVHCKKNRQTLLFSATISADVSEISKEFMKDAIEISAEKNVDPRKLKQVYYDVPDGQKFSLLVHLIKNNPSKLVMVFCNTKRNVDFISSNLKRNEIKVLGIHGDHSQNKRTNTMNRFKDMDFQVLVCTDVAARGLDIKNVSHVYNYDSPADTSQYVHRIGRTARAGKDGIAITILGNRDYENFGKIYREHPEIERLEVPQFERAKMETREGRFRDRRDSSRNFNREGFRRDKKPRGNYQRKNRSRNNYDFYNERDSEFSNKPKRFPKPKQGFAKRR